MNQDHSSHDMPVRMEMPAEPPMPTGGWEGQTLDMEPGMYQATWDFKQKKKGKYKGCKIRTYNFTLLKSDDAAPLSMKGEFTVHSRKSGKSIRTQIDILVDQNDDGQYGKDEVMISSGKEGYRIRNAITDYTSHEFTDALDLRRIAKSGEFSFEMPTTAYTPPAINFKNFKDKLDNEFSIYFTDYNMGHEFVVC